MSRSGVRAAPLTEERRLWDQGLRIVCGVDEVGRGPLAGPVVAAAVVLPAGLSGPASRRLRGVTDSKALTERERFDAYLAILEVAFAVGVGRVEPWDVDRDNILKSTLRAMQIAIARLGTCPEHLLVDGNTRIPVAIPQSTMVKGDARSRSIAAASVVAKVTRDAFMRDLDGVVPGYGFAQNKGYGTPEHVSAIIAQGPSPFHRRTFLAFYEAPALPF